MCRKSEDNGAPPNIPSKIDQSWRNRHSPILHRSRNAVERMVNRLKDFRRIANSYDRQAVEFLAAIRIAAILSYRL